MAKDIEGTEERRHQRRHQRRQDDIHRRRRLDRYMDRSSFEWWQRIRSTSIADDRRHRSINGSINRRTAASNDKWIDLSDRHGIPDGGRRGSSDGGRSKMSWIDRRWPTTKDRVKERDGIEDARMVVGARWDGWWQEQKMAWIDRRWPTTKDINR